MSLNLSTLLDVTLSLVFVFFTLSMFVSGIVEFINALLAQRSRLLQLALLKILETPAVADQYAAIIRAVRRGQPTAATAFDKFWNHPLVRVKRQQYFGMKPISYLSADSFSTVILDLLAKASPASGLITSNAEEQVLAKIRQAVADPTADPTLATLKELVAPLLQRSNTLADFKKNLETWYDGYMEQVSGWFKRYAQAVVWGVAILVAIALNINTLHVTNELFTNKTLRDRLVAQAEEMAREQTRSDTLGNDARFLTYVTGQDSLLGQSIRQGKQLNAVDSLRIQEMYLGYMHENVDALKLPIGWPMTTHTQPTSGWDYLLLAIGWLLTATALSFGAPFWFDLLLKVVNIRNVIRKPVSSAVPDSR